MLRDPFAAPKQSPRVAIAVAALAGLFIALPVAVQRPPLHGSIAVGLLGALCAWLTLRLIDKLGVAPERAYWVAAASVMGTGFMAAAHWSPFGDGRAALLAMPLLLLALLEAYGRGRPWLCGLLLGAAFALRPYAVFCAPFLLVALLAQKPGSRERALRSAGVFIAAASIGLLALFVASGWPARPQMVAPLAGFRWPPPLQAVMQGVLGAPRSSDGLALPLLSPFIAAIGFADWGRRSAVALWASLGLSAFAQIVRQGLLATQWLPSADMLDYLPILIVPLAIALNQSSRHMWLIWRVLIVLSIAAGAYYVFSGAIYPRITPLSGTP
jgi:hypothetical protein